MFDADILARSLAYVRTTALPREELALACGMTEFELGLLETMGALPLPTYVLFETAIRSPIRTLGKPSAHEGRAYYCPAVVHWLRRGRRLAPNKPGLLERLQAWFAADFAAALIAQPDARTYGWSHLFDANGRVAPAALEVEVSRLTAEWMNGGWAVCLRRWNGYHVITKDLERERIAILTDNGARDLCDTETNTLLDAIERLDSVMLPFAPYERPHGTPGLFIDRMQSRYNV